MNPEITVILTAPYGLAEVQKTLLHLRAQTAASKIELLLLVPRGQGVEPLPFDLSALHSVRQLEVGPFATMGEYLAEGTRLASAPVVVVGEDHSFPEPGWAEALLEAHREDYAAVGAWPYNGNPKSPVAWASFIINFGLPHCLPSHQTSYKRQVLLSLEGDLSQWLSMECRLHEHLRSLGYRWRLEERAVTEHMNVEAWAVFAYEQIQGTRQYGSMRSQDWGLPRRLLYAAAAPLIWAVRMRRVCAAASFWKVPGALLPRVYLAVAYGLAFATFGEVLGYLAGVGDAAQRRFFLEFRRRLYVRTVKSWLACASV